MIDKQQQSILVQQYVLIECSITVVKIYCITVVIIYCITVFVIKSFIRNDCNLICNVYAPV